MTTLSELSLCVASTQDSPSNSVEPENARAEQVARLTKLAETAVQEMHFESARDLLTSALEVLPEQTGLLMARGFASFQLADYPSALRDFKIVVAKNPEIQAGHVNLAALLLETGRTDEAVQRLRDGLRVHPQSLELNRLLANQLFRSQEWTQAAVHFGRIISQSPNDLPAWLAVAKCFFELKDVQTCRRSCEYVLRLEPENEVAKQNLAVLSSDGLSTAAGIPHRVCVNKHNPYPHLGRT